MPSTDELQSESLRNLNFTDLYICVTDPNEPSRYNTVPRTGQKNKTSIVPERFRESVDALVNLIEKEVKSDFSLSFDEMRFRGVKLNAFGKIEWVVLRRFPAEVPSLDRLNFAPEVLRAFRSWAGRSGLIVIGGSTRAGKTTTACALLKDYLISNGQTAITIEDPIEFDMQGPHGEDGFCLQIPIDNDDDWADRLKDALRSAPRYIFIGEVRTAKAARNLLRAANSGHLVICTVHGGRVEETLSAIVQIAQSELGDMAPTLLADGLVAVVHQRLEGGIPVNNILSTQDASDDPIRSIIRAGKLQTLSSEIHKQGILRRKMNDVPEEKPKPSGASLQAAPSAAVAAKPRVVVVDQKKKGLFGSWGGNK